MVFFIVELLKHYILIQVAEMVAEADIAKNGLINLKGIYIINIIKEPKIQINFKQIVQLSVIMESL